MGSEAAVLFVHGIQGNPNQFQFLVDALPESVECSNLLLPGHGKTAREFRASGGAHWLAAVVKETESLLARNRRVVYVGHSMGCLLGLLASRKLGNPYAGMLLLCCPFYFRLTPRYLAVGIRASRPPRPGEAPWVSATRAANSVHTDHPVQQLTLLHPYAELLRLMSRARSLSPGEPSGIRFFFSSGDEIVSPRSRKTAALWPRAQVQLMENCSHNYFDQAASQTLRAALGELLKEAQ